MSTHKHIDKICVFVTLITLLLTLGLISGKNLTVAVAASGDNDSNYFTENDLNADWDTSDATKITLSDDRCVINGNGAYASNGDIYIVYAGAYVLSGSLSDGNIIIDANKTDKIWIMLDDVSIHCDDDAAIRIEQADKVFLTLAEGTENTLSSGSNYNTDAVSAGVDGTIYSKDDLTINGHGTLSVTAEYQHGVVCNDDLAITGGCISVDAVQDGFHANDSICIRDADISITAGDDGITASNDDETSYFYIESGNINIPSCYEGIEAIDVTIAGGTIAINPTDDGINANGSGETAIIRITGGDITILNPNGRDADGLDSNRDIIISGGNLFISVPNDGVSNAIDSGTENGGVCSISGGTVLACGSSGMAEGFDSTSTQGFLMYTTSASSDTTVTLKDADSNELLSQSVPYSFSSVLVSTPEMKVGDTCTIIIGETEEEMTIDNSSNAGGFGGNRMSWGNGPKENHTQGMNGFEGNHAPRTGDFKGDQKNDTGVMRPQEMPDTADSENTEGEDAPPAMPQNEMNSTDSEDMPPTPPQDEMNRADNEDALPAMQQDGFRGNRMQHNLAQDDRNPEQTPDGSVLSIVISVIVLLAGCVIAFGVKGRT
ncbi:MAG: carbohydrate-binding domain-containing protein [Blautia sp.]|nr:carbohydrate-binding domain-containing protein [Lachnoclostridium sp.]MCM1212669.1 carbohydrate-binding domain-containing protein [Blautia sp.]